VSNPKNPEQAAAFLPPAITADRFFLTASTDRIRLAFGEHGPDGTIYRSAVVVSRANARELAQMLLKLLEVDAANSAEGSVGGKIH
jgi:hypothetical protein